MKKQIALVLTLMLMVGVIAACGSDKKESNNNTPGENATKQKIALVLPEKIGVNPFFELMDEGLKQAGTEFNVDVRTMESTDPAAFEQNLRSAVADNYDLIITATYQAEDALNKVAEENPKKSFAIVDTIVDQPNVRSVQFREYEAAYVLGALIGLSTQTNKVGAVAAIDAPILDKYIKGFEEGLKSTNAEAEYFVNYVGGFDDPAKGKELAIALHEKGADFIAGMAAASDLGVFEAAKELGFYTSGQDIDHTTKDPEHIILSQIKGVGTVTYETVKSFVSDSFEFGAVDYGLKENGVGVTFVTDESESPLSPFLTQENIDKAKAIAEDIKSGKIVVTNPSAQ